MMYKMKLSEIADKIAMEMRNIIDEGGWRRVSKLMKMTLHINIGALWDQNDADEIAEDNEGAYDITWFGVKVLPHPFESDEVVLAVGAWGGGGLATELLYTEMCFRELKEAVYNAIKASVQSEMGVTDDEILILEMEEVE